MKQKHWYLFKMFAHDSAIHQNQFSERLEDKWVFRASEDKEESQKSDVVAGEV